MNVRGPALTPSRQPGPAVLAGSLATLVAALWATPAFAAFCTGKQNGLWCDGNSLVTCSNGAQTASKACPAGCQAMPPGVPDQCKSASGPCAGKQDGAWCDGNNLLQCKGGTVAATKGCPYGCQAMPSGVADVCKPAPAPSGPCSGKQDGAWCDGSNLLQCKGGSVASSAPCPNGCDVKPPGTPDACKAAATPSGPCAGKCDGAWCNGNDLLQCKAGAVASSQLCANGCEVKPPGAPDVCKASATTPCTGQPDGAWCSGDGLMTCAAGKVANSKTCTYGCQAMPPGQPDLCKPAPSSTGPCAGKSDGQWCDSDKLLTCAGGKATASATCSNGCQVMPPGVPDQCKPEPQASGPCTGKADGAFCDGDTLRVCKGGQAVGSQACDLGCDGDLSQCKQPPFDPQKACAGKADGAWCVGSQLASCKGGKVANAFNCPDGCQPMPAGVPDTCKKAGGDPACSGKWDGTWCSGGDLVQCSNGLIAKAVSCAKGCAEPAGGMAACKVKAVGFCSGKPDGAWCDGGLLTHCKTGAAKSVFACPGGCQAHPSGVPDACKTASTPANPQAPSGSASAGESAGCATFAGKIDLWAGKGLPVWNQKDWGDQLGTCPGLTIHNSGCTITCLSMLHAYLGLKRTVDSGDGNDPVTENKWRTQYGGYAATSYEMGGKKVGGKCLVIWGSAPGGLVPAHGKNESTTCISPKAASFILNALKSGMPVVAGVHWPGGNSAFYGSSEDWHWVLIVGVDEGGPLINDPWGGKASVHLNQGGLGSYVIDDMYVFWQAGPQQGGMAPAPLDEEGEPTTEDSLPKTLQYIDDTPAPPTPTQADAGSTGGDGGSSASSSDGGPDTKNAAAPVAAKDSGCTGSRSPAKSSLWLALGVLWLALLVRRLALRF